MKKEIDFLLQKYIISLSEYDKYKTLQFIRVSYKWYDKWLLQYRPWSDPGFFFLRFHLKQTHRNIYNSVFIQSNSCLVGVAVGVCDCERPESNLLFVKIKQEIYYTASYSHIQ